MSGFGCDSCKNRLASSFLRVDQKYFHRGCFKCSVCNCDLEKTGYYKKDERFYCPVDFAREFGSHCEICKMHINGDRVIALNQQFHRKCFYCHICRNLFKLNSRVVFTGKQFYCEKCSQTLKITNECQSKSSNTERSSSRSSLKKRSNKKNKPSTNGYEAFHKELSQRLASQYIVCESHVSMRVSEGNESQEDALPPPIKPRKQKKELKREISPGSKDENLPPPIYFTHSITPSEAVVFSPQIKSGNQKKRDKKNRVSAMVKIFEEKAEADGHHIETSVDSTSVDSLQRLIEANECISSLKNADKSICDSQITSKYSSPSNIDILLNCTVPNKSIDRKIFTDIPSTLYEHSGVTKEDNCAESVSCEWIQMSAIQVPILPYVHKDTLETTSINLRDFHTPEMIPSYFDCETKQNTFSQQVNFINSKEEAIRISHYTLLILTMGLFALLLANIRTVFEKNKFGTETFTINVMEYIKNFSQFILLKVFAA